MSSNQAKSQTLKKQITRQPSDKKLPQTNSSQGVLKKKATTGNSPERSTAPPLGARSNSIPKNRQRIQSPSNNNKKNQQNSKNGSSVHGAEMKLNIQRFDNKYSYDLVHDKELISLCKQVGVDQKYDTPEVFQ